MSLFSKWVYGIDLDEEQARGDALDANLDAMNKADYGQGGRIYGEIAAEQGTAAADKASQAVLDDLASSKTGDVTAQVTDSFWEGWKSGRDRIWSGAGSLFGNVFKGIWSSFPWWFWIVALVLLFVYFGGLRSVRKATA